MGYVLDMNNAATKDLWAVHSMTDNRTVAIRSARSAAIRLTKKLNAACGGVGLYQVENVKSINGHIY